MTTFLWQSAVQLAIIALLWVVVARDATKLRDQHGATPAGISPFAWGALCGTTWIALIPYFIFRKKVDATTPATRERNLLLWWVALAVAAGIWSASNAADDDNNSAAQHALLAGIFVVCAVIAWSRDRAMSAAPAPTNDPGVAVSDK